MKSVSLNAYPRTLTRRGGSKQLRNQGRVPAVVYGRKQPEPMNVEVVAREFETLLHHSVSENILVDLAVQGDVAKPTRLALVQEVQHHPLSGKILHVDFHEVADDEKVVLFAPVETSGEATGVKNGGGVLEHVRFKLKVRALPKDLPEAIIIDVTSLEIGMAVHIGDIVPPAGVEILGDKHISVVAVAAPVTEAQEAEATAAEGATPGEVEMIKEKKEDGAAPAAAGTGDAKKADPKKAEEKKGDEKKPAEKKK